jgi:putative peptidoglycan lipid II flippase
LPPGTGRSYAAGIARGAGIIAVITVGSRVIGLVRTLTFSQTVGATCLGTAYVTANQVPNLVYELVLGGALSSVMVPLLARHAERAAAERADREQVSQITSALLTWCLLILVPITLAIVVVAGPIASLLNPANPAAHCGHGEIVSATASMLRIFAPQALLFGVTVILFGLLQAYRRFAAYAVAPLVNSIVVIASLIAFSKLARGAPLGKVPALAQFVLSAGATLGVAAMVLVALVPALRLGLRFRPALKLPTDVGRRAGGLALVGVVEMAATEISAVVVIALANGRGATGALVLFGYGSQVFSTLNAVLALSISISVFPVLAARDGTVFDRSLAGSTRAVVLVSCLGAALVAAVAVPAAHVLASQQNQVSELALGLACLGPGLVGTAVNVNLSRAMLAVGRLKIAAVFVAASILVGLVVQVILTETVPAHLVVAALALGQTVGTSVVAIPFVFVTRRLVGAASVRGVGRATLAGVVAAVGAGLIGFAASLVLPAHHRLAWVAAGALGAVCSIPVFALIALWLDDGDLRVILGRMLRTARLRQGERAVGEPGQPGYAGSVAHDHDGSRPRTALLNRPERQVALAVGAIAGGLGIYAIVASSSRAATAVLLLISVAFLLAAAVGSAKRPERRARRPAPRHQQLATELDEGIAIAAPSLLAGPTVAPTGADDASSLSPAD